MMPKNVISAGSAEFAIDPTAGDDQQQYESQNSLKTSPSTKSASSSIIQVIICGWPERSASAVAGECVKAQLCVTPFGLSLQEESGVTFQPDFQISELAYEPIRLIPPSRVDIFRDRVEKHRSQNPQVQLIVVDTSPDAKHRAELYADLGVPFILRSVDPAETVTITKMLNKSPAVILERTSPALGVIDQALLDAAKNFAGTLQEYKVTLNRSSATLDPLLSSKMVDALSGLTMHKIDAQEIQEEAAEHPLPTIAETVEEITLENDCSLVKLSHTRKERADDDEFARMAVKSIRFLQNKMSTVNEKEGLVFSTMDVLAPHAHQA